MSDTSILANVMNTKNVQKSIGLKLRAKRISHLLDLIKEVSGKHGMVKIIDIGGTETYWDIVPMNILDTNNVSILIVNLPGTDLPKDHGHFKFEMANGCNLSQFADNSFHIAHSNSVLEHVGD